MKLRIGEFARLGQVSVQTLRYYADLGLLVPSEVDRFSSYRYYTLDQLPRLIRILALKDLGISLDQIIHLLSEDLSNAELSRILLLKQSELREQVQEHLDRLDRINARLRFIEESKSFPSYEVIIKQVASLRVATVRGTIPSFWDSEPLWAELMANIERAKLTPCAPFFTLCHAVEPGIDIEVCAPVPDSARDSSEILVQTLPVVETMACTLHQGAFTGLITAFTALVQWVGRNGYQICGPDREIYLRFPEGNQLREDNGALTELQIPITKVEGTT